MCTDLLAGVLALPRKPPPSHTRIPVQSGKVKQGDALLRVDGFDCKGVVRDEIKRRVLGPVCVRVRVRAPMERVIFYQPFDQDSEGGGVSKLH